MSSLTWDQLYHPKLFTIFAYYHAVIFAISSILFAFAVYVILTKSTFSIYKYIILLQLIYVYLTECIFILIQPIILVPYFIFCVTGFIGHFFSNQDLVLVYYIFLFSLFAIMHTIIFAFLYRVSQVFINSKFALIFRDNHVWKSYIVLFVLGELYGTCKC